MQSANQTWPLTDGVLVRLVGHVVDDVTVAVVLVMTSHPRVVHHRRWVALLLLLMVIASLRIAVAASSTEN